MTDALSTEDTPQPAFITGDYPEVTDADRSGVAVPQHALQGHSGKVRINALVMLLGM